VYIMGSLSGTLYIGFTGNLHKRVFQHKFHQMEGFTNKYDVERLVYWASFDDVYLTLAREKQLKGWSRAKKIALIESRNPDWLYLAKEWYPWMTSNPIVMLSEGRASEGRSSAVEASLYPYDWQRAAKPSRVNPSQPLVDHSLMGKQADTPALGEFAPTRTKRQCR
jgi:putative endonuclease